MVKIEKPKGCTKRELNVGDLAYAELFRLRLEKDPKATLAGLRAELEGNWKAVKAQYEEKTGKKWSEGEGEKKDK